MLPTTQINDILQFDDRIRDEIATEMTGSWPIPVKRDNHLHCLAFYFARSGLPPRMDFDLYPPTWLVEIDWESGVILSVKETEPKEFGLPGNRFQPFAKVSYVEMNKAAAQKNLGDVIHRATALAAAYDTLLPFWMENRKPEPRLVGHFIGLFQSLTEPPLLPVYTRLGSEFFGWLKQHNPA
jgi:hypothetical protein